MTTDFPPPRSIPTEQQTRRLVEDWTGHWVHDGATDRIEIPASTDEHKVDYDPSIPGLFQPVVPDDAAEPPSLPHDVIYKLQGEVDGYIFRKENGAYRRVQSVSRAYADKLFRDYLRNYGVSEWRVQVAYWAVRAAGWAYWREEDDFELPEPKETPA